MNRLIPREGGGVGGEKWSKTSSMQRMKDRVGSSGKIAKMNEAFGIQIIESSKFTLSSSLTSIACTMNECISDALRQLSSNARF